MKGRALVRIRTILLSELLIMKSTIKDDGILEKLDIQLVSTGKTELTKVGNPASRVGSVRIGVGNALNLIRSEQTAKSS